MGTQSLGEVDEKELGGVVFSELDQNVVVPTRVSNKNQKANLINNLNSCRML